MRIALVAVCSALTLANGAAAQSPLSQLHDALHLSVVQEDGWRAYQQAVAPNPEQRQQARQAAALLPTLPTPRRLALIRAQMQTDLAAFDLQVQAVDQFYASLSPEQQHVFDRQTVPPPNAP